MKNSAIRETASWGNVVTQKLIASWLKEISEKGSKILPL